MNPDVKPPQADDDVVHLPASSSTHSHHKLVYDDLLVVKASVECEYTIFTKTLFNSHCE